MGMLVSDSPLGHRRELSMVGRGEVLSGREQGGCGESENKGRSTSQFEHRVSNSAVHHKRDCFVDASNSNSAAIDMCVDLKSQSRKDMRR